MLQATQNQQKNHATTQDLEKIVFSTLQLAGTGMLSPLARRWLAFCVVLARLGYVGIHAPMWAIVKAQYRAQGQTRSESTAYRGLRALETAGYIRRQKYRLGPDKFATIVHFELEKFGYWLREKAHIQSVTCDYINSQLSICEETEVTNQGSRVNSQDSSIKDNKPARAKSYKEQFKKPLGAKKREHPVFYTLKIVTRGMGKAKRRLLLARAYTELFAPKLRSSGADFQKWGDESKWLELTISERETVAREQILPYLENMSPIEKVATKIRQIVKRATRPAQTYPRANDAGQATPQEIARMVQQAGLEDALRIDFEDSQGPPEKSGLSDEELRILERAKERAKAVRGCR